MKAAENGAAFLHSSSGWNCRVLIVEDDEILRAHLRRLLKRAHFDVQVAGSANEAMHVLQALHFHILLTNVQLPSMDGFELCRKVRTGFLAPHLYIQVLTDDHIVNRSSDEGILGRMEFARNRAHAHCAQVRHSRWDRARRSAAASAR